MQLGNWKSRDEEKRKLRIEVETLRRALEMQKEARKNQGEELHELRNESKENHERIKELEEKCRELQEQCDQYRGMIFKANKKEKTLGKVGKEGNEDINIMKDFFASKNKKIGGQIGHKGHGRELPKQVDEIRRIYLDTCPDCGEPFSRTNTIETHTIEDIPSPERIKSKVTQNETEVQWCRKCKRVVKAKIAEVIPGSRLGINAMTYVLIEKYLRRNTWKGISWNLEHWYGIHVSCGSLVGMAHRASEWFDKQYNQILEEIRVSPVKHADETSWRVNGINWWAWLVATNKHAYFAIEESRGKGVSERLLKGSHREDVLVRDDYGAYKKLDINQQSCWAHLLRKSHEASTTPGASDEVCLLHKKLKKMYSELEEILKQPFNLTERQKHYNRFSDEIATIINANYQHKDTEKIQTRIANQKNNLITALIHENVPLTNNLAERNIRPLVVTRKISGGSRSIEGAKTHAVNMSILQTICIQKQPIVATLSKHLLASYNNSS